MKVLNLVTLILVIVGGLNWGLVGLANFDVFAMIFGIESFIARLIYIVFGLSALWQLVPFVQALSTDELRAERHS